MHQLDIFINSERHPENSKVNQRHHDDNIEHFAKQDQLVLTLLQQGMKLTTGQALLKYKIGDLRRRVKSLRDAGVPISDEFAKDAQGNRTRYKRYFITQTS